MLQSIYLDIKGAKDVKSNHPNDCKDCGCHKGSHKQGHGRCLTVGCDCKKFQSKKGADHGQARR